MGDSTVILDVDVESVGDEVLGDHHAGCNYAALLRQILLAKVLQDAKRDVLAELSCIEEVEQ